MWIQLIVRMTLDFRGSSYRAISHDLLDVSCSTFANRIHSLDGFLTFLGLPAFTGSAVAQWLRYCATNRKVAGSIPDGVTGIFH
jgi:hypothetical protein